MKRIVHMLDKLNWARRAFAVLVLCAATIALSGQTFTTLHSFDGADGGTPFAALVQATNGDLYGTTYDGGAGANCTFQYGCGTIFKITRSGTLTTLYSFCSQSNCTDGANPWAELIQATNGDFYGTTNSGGANCAPIGGCGTVFKITPSGALTTLYSFCSQSNCTDGAYPQVRLVQATNGDLYGTTAYGGIQKPTCNTFGSCGTVFKITPGGTLTTLYIFCSQIGCTDGAYPNALVQATNGDLYGTTNAGGVQNSSCVYGGCGTVFKIAPSGTLTTLYSFCSQSGCKDGWGPNARLVQATQGDLYGTTESGGTNTIGTAGTVFKITPGGTLTTLYSFCAQSGCTDGQYPAEALVQATNGDLYGTTYEGGADSVSGTVFKITQSGTLTTLYSFCSQGGSLCTDGQYPYAGLVQATNGKFYGTTSGGGAEGYYGTVFSLSVGLAPFAGLRPRFGDVGTIVRILGQGLTGSTGVTFNGTAASFTVVSDTEIKTTVPTGATTGRVEVVTSTGTLSSGGPFKVRP
jgi:uncharacterized repeat protein (TIGR03803 family)